MEHGDPRGGPLREFAVGIKEFGLSGNQSASEPAIRCMDVQESTSSRIPSLDRMNETSSSSLMSSFRQFRILVFVLSCSNSCAARKLPKSDVNHADPHFGRLTLMRWKLRSAGRVRRGFLALISFNSMAEDFSWMMRLAWVISQFQSSAEIFSRSGSSWARAPKLSSWGMAPSSHFSQKGCRMSSATSTSVGIRGMTGQSRSLSPTRCFGDFMPNSTKTPGTSASKRARRVRSATRIVNKIRVGGRDQMECASNSCRISRAMGWESPFKARCSFSV